jgi:hypothetical protein
MSDRLLHTKVSKKKPLNHFPKKEDGHDGDMQIVSIKGKGTYLCIKDKSEWKISEKFNPRNKFDTHIFDEITTRKIKGKGGLSLSLQSESVTTTTYSGKTASITTNTQPIIKVGDGVNKAVLSSLKSTPLTLQTGASSSSQITLYSNNNITTSVGGTGSFLFDFNSNDISAGRVRILNVNTDSDGGNSSLDLEVADTNADPFVRYIYRHDTPSSNVHWAHGMDGSDSDKFKLNYFEGATLVNPSTSTGTNFQNVLTMTKTGDVTVGNDLNVTGDAVVDGGNLTVDVSSGDPKIHLQIGGSTKYTIGLDDSDSDLFKINSGSTIADPSDFEMDSSGNVVVTGTLTSSAGVCGGPKVTNHVTNDADDTMAGALTISKEGTQLKLEYNANDYATLAVADTGDLTIATVGDGTTDSDLTLDADGDIFLDAVCASGTGIKLKNAGTLFGYFDIHHSATHLKIFENGGASTDDYFNIGVYANGATTITTLDAGGATAHLTLDIDGSIIFDPADGNYIAKNNGTEFSVANSAYAGMILGYTRLEGDVAGSGGEVTFEIQNSMTVEDASHEVTFKTPPSEKVEIEGTCVMNISSTDTRISVGLSDNSTYNKVGEQFEYDNVGIVFSDDEIDDHVITFKFVLEAAQLASVGSSNTFYIGFSTSGSTKTAYLAYGLRLPHNIAYHPFVLKATALPATIEDGL